MKRGIMFNIPNARGKFLYEILHDLDIWHYIWQVDPVESYKEIEIGETLFPSSSEDHILTSKELSEIISEGENQYLIFVDLKGYRKKEEVRDIRSYEDYLESECQFVLIIVDTTEVYVFAKQPELNEQLFKIAKRNGYKDIKYLTDENAPTIRFE
ncbi:DUF2691 family protein [Ornithinibacillus californiensis]|uniref:DUF2691 family protein n=1 Tax=Ornithinibacillus californiensis TaxID=161536 RepID=UPI00064D8495|nr:DUF2691 family protein [Ornithinibacillus californiensis]